jgi:phage-related tail protein
MMLASIVWAGLASTFAGYYFLQNGNNTEQLKSAQNSMNKVASSYSDATKKYDSLLAEYGSLYGNYSYFSSDDYATLMPPLGSAIADLGKNYTDLFEQNDMNKTYNQLLIDYEALLQKANITRTDFGNLLSEYYDLFNLSTLRELALSIS